MERYGELDNTVILFTSDHGESLDEHGYFFNHGDFVYGPAANVPLVWSEAGENTGVVSSAPASLVDCVPVLLASLTGVVPPEEVDGQVPAEAGRALFGESGFCRFPHLNDRLGWLLPREIAQSPDRVLDWRERWEPQANRAKQRFVESDGWKLVYSPNPEQPRLELFDLTKDPGETRDLSDRYPERAKSLADSLTRWIAEGDQRKTTAGERILDEATREQMNALGYIGD
jgi:arylsulfatase A-like enzyme